MSTHNICFRRELRKYRYFLVENKRIIKSYARIMKVAVNKNQFWTLAEKRKSKTVFLQTKV